MRGKVTIDLNRAGVALIEIVSDADMRSGLAKTLGPDSVLSCLVRTPQEAAAYVKKVQSILRRVGASDGDMEKVDLTHTGPASN